MNQTCIGNRAVELRESFRGDLHPFKRSRGARCSCMRQVSGRAPEVLRSGKTAGRTLESPAADTCRLENRSDQSSQTRGSSTLDLLAVAIVSYGLLGCGPAEAFYYHPEPANALSIPTWIIHVSSVIEWTTAMFLMWRYAEVTGNPRWKGMAWGMMPLFAGALAACTYHLFYNSPQVDFLVVMQAGLTWIGNTTLWIAAYRIYRDSQAPSQIESSVDKQS